MIGKYRVYLKTNNCVYDFIVKRKYTVLYGNSATGKTEFISAISTYLRTNKLGVKGKNFKSKDFVEYSCKLDTFVLTEEYYNSVGLESIKNGSMLVLIDEPVIDMLNSNKELNKLDDYDNYYIIASRDLLKMSSLAISVDEIYEIKTSDKKYPISDKSLYKSRLELVYY